MLEQLLTGLLLAGVSGISFIAYKHPAGYQKIDPFLRYVPYLVLICGTVWNIAVDVSWIRIHLFLAEGKDAAATAALDGLKVPFIWLLIGCLGVSFYSTFLRYIHDFLKSNRPE